MFLTTLKPQTSSGKGVMLNDKTIKILKALLVKKKVVKGTAGCIDRRCIIVISISIVSDTVAI